MKLIKPTPAHRAFRDDLIEVLRRHGATLRADQLLAISAQLVGQIIALQDQRVITPDIAMQIVASNIEAGNAEAIESSLGTPAGAA